MIPSRQLLSRLGCIACVIATACRPTAPVRPVDVQPLPTPQAALDMLRQTGAARQTLRAAGRVTYYGDKGRVRVRVEVVAKRADLFRVATISPFEQPIDVMTCDGAQIFLLSKGVLRAGQATPNNVARLLPLPLAPGEIVDTLMGGIPTGDGFSAESLERDGDRWRLRLDRPNSQERVIVTIDPQRKVVVAATIERPAGTPYLKASFEDFMDLAQGGHYPEKIQMTMPGRDVDVRLKLRQPEINVGVDESLFRIVPPAGQSVRPL